MKGKLLKGTLVVLLASIISTLGIFASDVLQGKNVQFAGLLGGNDAGVCAEGMVPFSSTHGILCVDMYESSPSTDCPFEQPKNALDSEANVSDQKCYAASVSSKLPWSYISLPQAQQMCAHSGKRIPTASEWYRIALGTRTGNCVTSAESPQNTGSSKECLASSGAFDMIGNMWEWVDETVVNNTFEGRSFPEEGYITSVDSNGVAITSGKNPDPLYDLDYVWTKSDGVFGMIRGGFYGSETDAGVYAMNASVPTSFSSQGVGFRCVEDVI